MSSSDEMCNFYLMFYGDSTQKSSRLSCNQENHPSISASFPSDSDTALEVSASAGSEAAKPRTPGSPLDERDGVTRKQMATEGSTKLPIEENRPPTSPEPEKEVILPEWKGEAVGEWEGVHVNKAEPQEVQTTFSTVDDKELTSDVKGIIYTDDVDENPAPDLSTFRVVTDWPSLSSAEQLELGQVSGVALNSKGNIVIFHRGNRVWDAR